MRVTTGPTRASRSIIALLAVAGLVPALVRAGPGRVEIPGSIPPVFMPTYYANSPAPGTVTTTTPTTAGNALVSRLYAGDGAPNVLVVSPATLPVGSLSAVQIFNQSGPGAIVQAFVLRPAASGVPGDYDVVYGATLTTAGASGAVESFAVAPFAILAGDKLAHYGQNVPFDMSAAGVDAVYYPAAAAPSGTISLGSAAYPTFIPADFGQQPRTYSIAATVDVTTTVIAGGLRKFVDGLPGLDAPNNLGQQIPVAVADTASFPGADYYEIGIRGYTERMHSDLPATGTKLRGYYQRNAPTGHAAGKNHYLGPVIVAVKDRPVRIKIWNELDTTIALDGTSSNASVLMPVDKTVMGAGKGNVLASDGVTPCDPVDPAQEPFCADFSENRAILHLHGGFTPWISDGIAHQWITPASDPTKLKVGTSTREVPDMSPANPVTLVPSGGTTTFYYPNQQSGRLMFYHDHAYGITRLNVYYGTAAGYLLVDPAERALTDGTLPAAVDPTSGTPIATTVAGDLPLVIQDKTFVPADIGGMTGGVEAPSGQDTRWNLAWGGPGDLWFPHIYEPNQDPTCAWGIDCMNPLGRWDWGPWIWPPVQLPNPNVTLPNPSVAPEAFMDVMLVNGTVYPTMPVERKAYRLRILNAANDRFLNLQLYYAIDGATFDPARAASFDRVTGTACKGGAQAGSACTEVAMVPRDGTTYTYTDELGQVLTSTVPFDGRPGGVPDPRNAGPKILQIGTEGGILPAATLKNSPPIPITYDTDPKSMTVGNVVDGTFLLGPAERVDAIVDFSKVPVGAKLILYNDAPAAWPAGDQRYDYYTFGPDWTANGGAPATLPGYGPNTRTVMQFVVGGAQALPFDFAAVSTQLPHTYAATQERPLVPTPDYRAAFADIGTRANYVKIFNTVDFAYSPTGSTTCPNPLPPAVRPSPLPGDCVVLPIQQKAIAEEFDPMYGRMSALLGTEAMVTGNQGQNTFGFFYVDPTTEVLPQGETQLWKLTHNGVDTHAIHFHLVNVQVLNRVDWAGVVKTPDPNELGWKETVRMNPLEDIIVAVRAKPPLLPFSIPESTRLRDVTRPLGAGAVANQQNFTNPWPYAQPQGTVPVVGGTITTNTMTSFAWEYVWHCHLLGHEENDMMRPLIMTNVSNYNTADTLPPQITAVPGNLAQIGPFDSVTVSVADLPPSPCPGTPAPTSCAYLASGLASFTVNGTAVAGSSVVLSPPAGGWTLGAGALTVTAQATDRAAVPNTASATFTYDVIVRDNTPPTLTWGAPTPAANVRGWNNTDVGVPYTATDAQSPPVTSSQPNPVVITGEGVGLTAPPVTVTDAAGNSATFTWPGSVRIDRTPPVVTNASVTPPSRLRGNGTSGVRFTGTASDALSGLFINPNANEGTYRITNNKSTQVLQGTFNVSAAGAYSFSVNVPRANTGTTRRIWTATISVRDNADNVGSTTATYIIDPQLP